MESNGKGKDGAKQNSSTDTKAENGAQYMQQSFPPRATRENEPRPSEELGESPSKEGGLAVSPPRNTDQGKQTQRSSPPQKIAKNNTTTSEHAKHSPKVSLDKQTIDGLTMTTLPKSADSIADSLRGTTDKLMEAAKPPTDPFKVLDPSKIPKPALLKKKHQRNVSWGKNISGNTVPMDPTASNQIPSNLQQPNLPDSPTGQNVVESPKLHPAEASPSDIEELLESPKFSSQMSTSHPKGPISLADLAKVNPLESEAETYILDAIEGLEPLRTRANTGTTSLLSHVPEEAVDMFIALEVEKAEISEKLEETQSDLSAPEKPMLLRDRTASEVSLISQSTRRKQTNNVATMPPKSSETKHQRQKTLENTLYGLTTALNSLHGHAIEKSSGSIQSHQEIPETFLGMGESTAELDNAIQHGGSAEALAAAASILSHRKKSDANSDQHSVAESIHSVESSHKYAGHNWSLLRNAVKAMGSKKKSDDNVIPESERDDLDIEIGDNQEIGDRRNFHSSYTEEALKNGKRNFMKKLSTCFKDFEDFLAPRHRRAVAFMRAITMLVVPLIGSAFILYYFVGNPKTGIIDIEASKNGTLYNKSGQVIGKTEASASWWLLFTSRHIIVVALTKITEVFVIDFLCLGTRWLLSLLGPYSTLLVIQSRGWPFMLTFWGVYAFCLLGGDSDFAAHWLFYLDIGIFTDTNPSGSITSSAWNMRILSIAVSVGVVVSIKRLYLGIFLGRKTFNAYAHDLSRIMKKVLLISEVANLAREFELQEAFYGREINVSRRVTNAGLSIEDFQGYVREIDEQDNLSQSGKGLKNTAEGSTRSISQRANPTFVIDPQDHDPITGGLSQSQKAKISELLGAWEDPEKEHNQEQETVSISSILQFRRSVAFMENPHLFSVAFGLADTRENCIQSAQYLYQRLLLQNPNDDILTFEVLSLVALRKGDDLDQIKLKELIRVLRPDRNGNVAMLDFVKSIDTVYKEMRTLRASIKNSQKLDRALEKIFNIFFFVIMATVILSVLGFNPLALFLSMSSFVVAFAFMISSASSKYFEGLLFILLRKPYDIGDHIHVSDINTDTSPSGSPSWFVRDISLHTTTVVFATTGERATLSNGSLANSRIMNMARSPKALLYVYLKFGIEAPFERIQIFEEAARKFVKARPREWLNFSGFRVTRIEADLGFVEYVIVVQHRESWQQLVPLLVSRAQLSAFCLELSKKLDLRYQSPPLPVDLSLHSRPSSTDDDAEKKALLAKFEGLTADSVDIEQIDNLFSKKA